jgi:MFS family permease
VGYLELLRRNTSFRLLFLATLGSLLGTWLATIALTVEIYDRTHSGAWVSALLIAIFVPAVVVGLLVGPLLDRLERRRLMVAADGLRAAVFVALPFVHGSTWIVVLAGVSGLGNAVFRPAVNAALPNLVDESDLEKGNALFQTVENIAWAAGPLIGGIIVASSGTHVAYWINAASFIFSALVIRQIPARKLQAAAAISRGHFRDLADGFAVARRSRALQTVIIAWSIAMIGSACVDVGEIVLAKASFNAGDFGFGLLFGAGGLGLAIGSLTGGLLAERRSIGSLYGASILFMALGYGAAAASPNVWVASCAMVVAGAGNGAASLYNVLLIQRGVEDAFRGRAFTIAMSVTYAVLGLGMAVAGPLTTALGGRWIYAIGAAAYALAGLVALALGPRMGVSAPPSVEERLEALPTPPVQGAPVEMTT